MDILPSYRCNFTCPFCCVRSFDQGDLLDLDWLEENIYDISNIDSIDVLGGEPSLLPVAYQDRLITICTQKLNGNKPKMYTNLSRMPAFPDRVELIVSYDPCDRPNQSRVLANMLNLDQDFQINMVVTKNLISNYGNKILALPSRLNRLSSIKLSSYTCFEGLEDLTPHPEQLMEFISLLIHNDYHNKIHFYPISSIKGSYIKSYTPEHTVEILPNQKYRMAIKDFQIVDEFDTFDEAKKFYYDNIQQFDAECQRCEFEGRCLRAYKQDACYWDKKIMQRIVKELKL